MEVSIPAATRAIEDFLRQSDEFSDAIISECDDLLLSIWYVENSQIRLQIIQAAALNTGWLQESDLN